MSKRSVLFCPFGCGKSVYTTLEKVWLDAPHFTHWRSVRKCMRCNGRFLIIDKIMYRITKTYEHERKLVGKRFSKYKTVAMEKIMKL